MRYLIALVSILLGISGVAAGELRVSPILLDVRAPGAATTLTLRNEGKEGLPIQIRIFRWTGGSGEPVLEPTRDVVVSPPAATLAPGTEYVVRVVRVSKQPVVGEESYRIIVDELPAAKTQQSIAVRFVLRYSIPVFFSASDATPPKIAWSLQQKGKDAVVTAVNSGHRRLRVAELKLLDNSGNAVIKRDGLVGYALGQRSTSWTLPTEAARRGPLKLSVLTETGVVHAPVSPKP